MHNYDGVHCFRGTTDLVGWLHDFDIATVQVQPLGAVAVGFWRVLSSILPVCVAQGRPTAICGHSLGAAEAILYAGWWAA